MRTTEKLETKRLRRTEPSKVFVLLLLALSILIAGFLFINSSFFSLGSIVVEGNKHVLADDIINIAGMEGHINIFRINTSELKKRLLRDLRIEQVEISRRFPAAIVIQVKERQPSAYMANSYGFVELDHQGIVLSAFKTLRQMTVPMITGTSLGDIYVGDKVDTPEVLNILAYLSGLDEYTLSQISEVNMTSSQKILVYTTDSVPIRLGNTERATDKAKMTNQILQDLKEHHSAVEYIDLTYSSPFIKFKQ